MKARYHTVIRFGYKCKVGIILLFFLLVLLALFEVIVVVVIAVRHGSSKGAACECEEVSARQSNPAQGSSLAG